MSELQAQWYINRGGFMFHQYPHRYHHMSTDPSKTSGQFLASKGGLQETLGNLTGSTNLQQHGKEDSVKGQAEENQAKSQGIVEGVKEQVMGVKDSVLGSVTGDKPQQAQGNLRREKGETQQDINRNF